MNIRDIRREDYQSDLGWIASIYRNKKLLNMNNNEIAKYINEHSDRILGESTIRCKAKDYNIGRSEYKREVEQNTYDKGIMVINDLHVPFQRDDVIEHINNHKDEITTLVIIGDYLDCYSISNFPKIREVLLKEEVVAGYNFMKKIRDVLGDDKKIIICNGNHEERYKANISRMHEKDLQQFINPNILEMYVEGFTIYEGKKKIEYKPIKNLVFIPHWYFVSDGVVYCHPKDFTKVKGKMLENVTSHFINKGIDFSMVVFGHTHKYSCAVVDRFGNKCAVENCCMCKEHEYADAGKLGYTSQTYGYSIIKYNVGDKVSLNNVKTYLLEGETKDKDYYSVKV